MVRKVPGRGLFPRNSAHDRARRGKGVYSQEPFFASWLMIAQTNDSCSAVRRRADRAIPRWKNNNEHNTKVNRNYSESGKGLAESKTRNEIQAGHQPRCLRPSAIPVRLTRIAGGKAASSPRRNDTPTIRASVAGAISNTGRNDSS